MDRRAFLHAGMALAAGARHARSQEAAPEGAIPLEEQRELKITGVRLVRVRPRRPLPRYEPAPGSWSTRGVEVAGPMSVYPKYKARRALFMPEPGGPPEVYRQ